jgi:hypothetical protein
MKPQSLTDPRPGLTKRQTEVLERLESGRSVKRIATDIGVTPAAVYQTIDRLRGSGQLPPDFTASGRPPRRAEGPGTPPSGPATTGPLTGGARLAEARSAAGGHGEAELVDAAIAASDSPTLAYLLGRADVSAEPAPQRPILEAALRRLGQLPAADEPGAGSAQSERREGEGGSGPESD